MRMYKLELFCYFLPNFTARRLALNLDYERNRGSLISYNLHGLLWFEDYVGFHKPRKHLTPFQNPVHIYIKKMLRRKTTPCYKRDRFS